MKSNRGGRPRNINRDKLPIRMREEVKSLVIALKELLNESRLSDAEVCAYANLPLTGSQFHDRLHRLSGPPWEVCDAIVHAAATGLNTTVEQLRADLGPLLRPVYADLAALTGAPATGAPRSRAAAVDVGTHAGWLLELLGNARENDAVAGIDDRFGGDDTALAAVLIAVADIDPYAVGLLVDAITVTNRARAAALCETMIDLDEHKAATALKTCELSTEPEDSRADVVEHPALLVEHDPDLAAGRRIAALLAQKRETGRVVREIRARVEADARTYALETEETGPFRLPPKHQPYNPIARSTTSGVQFGSEAPQTRPPRPRCSLSFLRVVFGITMGDAVRGPQWLADLLLALYEAGEFIALSHCVTALFDLRKEYGKIVFRAASRVFENISTDAVLQILAGICTEAHLDHDLDGEALFDDLDAVLWALDDVDLVLVAQKVAKLSPSAEFSVGHFVEYLPNISSFWRKLVAGPDGYLAGVLLERALTDWMAWDRNNIAIEDFQPLRCIANALIDAAATDKPPRWPGNAAPVTTLIKRMLVDRPVVAVLLLLAVLLDQHPRMHGFLATLLDDADAHAGLVRTIGLVPTHNACLRLFERLSIDVPAYAGTLSAGIAETFPDHARHLLVEDLHGAPTFRDTLRKALLRRGS
ncbi:hypothetical protein D7D52_22110 [Nocardia yunnanensis]|uniref:Uncharacterized protein n=1 Tax=Nocardia yunnanensis TaxID=2382165 RepID=A0A386ZEY8_9NOCA|nr:hypothetical protein D7D52_22110 [Nocardia yunnanensis]